MYIILRYTGSVIITKTDLDHEPFQIEELRDAISSFEKTLPYII